VLYFHDFAQKKTTSKRYGDKIAQKLMLRLIKEGVCERLPSSEVCKILI
jgi:hypothetical protein